MSGILKKIFGSANDREISRLAERVDAVNLLEPGLRKLSDAELSRKTIHFRERLGNGGTLDGILPEAFAVAREASARVLGQRHFDEQLMGGLVLHDGKIAEMKTGEGKTLAATLPVYLNALPGKGVHVVTVNDYLARRDSDWMGRIYSFLGLSVGVITSDADDRERGENYAADVTYGTNSEFGFDYLRDNMKYRAEDFVQRGFNYAIVDEVDSILIDEARTPLIISGRAEHSTSLYGEVNEAVRSLRKDIDFVTDEKARHVNLTDEGVAKIERLMSVENLFDPTSMEILHHVTQSLKAHALFEKDTHYMVEDGKVLIVDEFTGRALTGRRYSDGLHQALEAKEKVRVEGENQTMASITYQNYFRMYEKLAGMTGTADTEAAEFSKIYGLEVVVLPTHRKMIRLDHPDIIYRTAREKYKAVAEHIAELRKKGQPVLVGTISIANSELVSRMLAAEGIPHQVLNAKYHEKEALIVAKAGQPGSVTISTNMAGRGTDIVLGPGVPELGGLFILGTERHESRRVDNQLRGRSGRQGDPGESLFFLSLEDDLLRIFGGDRMKGIMKTLGMTEGVPLTAKIISRSIENSQKQVESRNFDLRKHLLEYDDVMNRQREIIYRKRRSILFGADVMEDLDLLYDEESQAFAMQWVDDSDPVLDEFNEKEFLTDCHRRFGFFPDPEKLKTLENEEKYDYFYENAKKALSERAALFRPDSFKTALRYHLLNCVDVQWKNHLLAMDHLKEGVSLRGYAQKDPLREYQKEGFELFGELLARIRTESVATPFRLRPDEPTPERRREKVNLNYTGGGGPDPSRRPVPVKIGKVGRNDPCPCG
ncbi:MAG: preprotein translocase subunit SecA, partial [Deltaproteobacteria bacterium]|nr:preprotein translocase subunit SecA [Deltaproteobacteria bacterium]